MKEEKANGASAHWSQNVSRKLSDFHATLLASFRARRETEEKAQREAQHPKPSPHRGGVRRARKEAHHTVESVLRNRERDGRTGGGAWRNGRRARGRG